MKKLFIITMLLCSIGLYAASITFWKDGKPRRKVSYSDIRLMYIDQRHVGFSRNGKVYRINRNSLDSFSDEKSDDIAGAAKKPEVDKAEATEKPEVDKAEATEKPEVDKAEATEPEKSFPTQLAAYILHCRYLFGAGQSDGWHYGKEVTVSGVVDVSDITLTNPNDLVMSNANGKYQVPMFFGKIICLTNEKPPGFSPNSKTKHYIVMKYKGVVAKSGKYKTAFIDNAKFISSRPISRARTCDVIAKAPNDSKVAYIKRSAKLARANNIPYSAYIEQNARGIGRIQCHMGTDPEAYAMELYWVRKLFKGTNNLSVTVFGLPYEKSNQYSTLNDGSIVSWGVR